MEKKSHLTTLVIGIGGIGSRIVSEISTLIRDEDRKRISLVCIDTNISDLSTLKQYKVETIQVSDTRLVRDYIREYPQYAKWFPMNKFLLDRSILQGAGQVRTISRLAFLASVEEGKFNTLSNEIKRIRAIDGEADGNAMAVMVVGSITGGTGAGLFELVPLYVRHLLKQEAGLDKAVIRGMFIGSDITGPKQPDGLTRAAVHANAYACIRELNAFYLGQTEKWTSLPIELEFFHRQSKEDQAFMADRIRARAESSEGATDDDFFMLGGEHAVIPYDYTYLIESGNAKGGIGTPPIDMVEKQAAHMIFTLMLTPVGSNALSVEDNLVLGSMAADGMNRYASAGLTRLVYPVKLAREYVVTSRINDMIGKEWLLIDVLFGAEVRNARAMKAHTGTIQIPTMEKLWPELFEREVLPGKSGTVGRLGGLFDDAFIKDVVTGEPKSKAEEFTRQIKEQIEGILQRKEIAAARAACELERGRMRTIAGARSAISEVESGLEQYEKTARMTAQMCRQEIANMVMPPDMEVLRYKEEDPMSIFALIGKVHPLAARYLIYDLIRNLDTVKSTAQSLLSLDYEPVDYDTKKAGTQSATDVLDALSEINIPILGDGKVKKGLDRLAIKAAHDAEDHEEVITTFLRNSLTVSTCEILMDRLRRLADNYQLFFDRLAETMDENAKRIQDIENTYRVNPLGQVGVYCSEDAFRRMYQDYINMDKSDKADIPLGTMYAIFTELYEMLCLDLATVGRAISDREKEQNRQLFAARLAGIFDKAVAETIREEVNKKGEGIIVMNIREALAREFTLLTGKTKGTYDAYEKEVTEYIMDRVEAALVEAEPMVACNVAEDIARTEIIYLSMNTVCADKDAAGRADKGRTAKSFLKDSSPAYDGKTVEVLVRDEFDPQELICFKARYMLMVENLIKYAEGSENEKAYRERIAQIGKTPSGTSEAVQNSVVTPHINRYWHQDAFLPEIDPARRERAELDRKKAFLYAMGLDMFRRQVDPDLHGRVVWNFDVTDKIMYAYGDLVRATYQDLYRSLLYNRKIVEDILKRARSIFAETKGFYDASSMMGRILDLPLIEDFIQVSEDAADDGTAKTGPAAPPVSSIFGHFLMPAAEPGPINRDENLLDVLEQMYDAMDKDEWRTLFDALDVVLDEYLSQMLDGSEALKTEAYCQILITMYENSRIARRLGGGVPTGGVEMAVVRNIQRMLEKRRPEVR